MNTKVTIEVDVKHEAIVRRVLAMQAEMEQLALTAPVGTVFDACEEAVIDKGRDLQGQMLGEAVARRIEAAEKKGSRSVGAFAGGRRRTAGRMRPRRLLRQTGESLASERAQGVVNGADGTGQVAGDDGAAQAVAAGQQDLAAAYGKSVGGAQPCL